MSEERETKRGLLVTHRRVKIVTFVLGGLMVFLLRLWL